MGKVLLCGGRSKCIAKTEAFIQGLAASKKIEILASVRKPKPSLLRSNEELRLLYRSEAIVDIQLPDDLAKSLDFCKVSDDAWIGVKMSSFSVSDSWLKWNIKTALLPFKSQNGQVEIKEERVTGENRGRICHYILKGPVHLTSLFSRQMIEKELGDPKTQEYFLL